MSHAHADPVEKLPLHKHIKRFGLFEWISVKLWLFALLIAHFWAISRVIVQSSGGGGFDIMGNMLVPAVICLLAINRSALEERKHGDKWMMIGTTSYWVGLLTLLLFMNNSVESIVGITWLLATGGLFASWSMAGGHHH